MTTLDPHQIHVVVPLQCFTFRHCDLRWRRCISNKLLINEVIWTGYQLHLRYLASLLSFFHLMNATARYLLLVLGFVISIHTFLSFTHESYSRATSISQLRNNVYGLDDDDDIPPFLTTANKTSSDLPWASSEPLSLDRKANATFVILCRNSDLDGTIRSIREIEDRFNRRHGYPYVLLNEVPFTEEFQKRITVLTSAKVEFGLIPRDHWYQPDWIDEERATASRDKMVASGIIYGGSVSYRNMCRFNSGFFYQHPLMQKYRWYWRIEPDVHFHCDVNVDPFLFMEDNNKTYSFTITMYEYEATIPTLWGHVHNFIKEHPQYIAEDNALGFMNKEGNTYNLCHFWSNFEIADMDFWRSEAYSTFFDYLDSKGGFYYERWGDAPVHSIGAALFLPRSKIHFWDEIGYEHNPYTHCPKLGNNWEKGKCSCNPTTSFDYDGYSCMSKWDRFMES